jgi:hypothetical protein
LFLISTESFAQDPLKAQPDGNPILGFCCMCFSGLFCVGIVAGGGFGIYYLATKKAPDKYPNPIDVSAPLTHEKFGVRFQHPKEWKPAQETADGACMMSQGPLLFYCIQVMPNADEYIKAFKAESKLPPEQLDYAAKIGAVGYAGTLGGKVLMVALDTFKVPPPNIGKGTLESKLCGREAYQFPFTVQDGAYTGECRATVVGKQFVMAMWLVWTSHLDRWRPGVDLVMNSLTVAES